MPSGSVSASLLAHLGAEWSHLPVMLMSASAPLIVSPSSLSLSLCFLPWAPNPSSAPTTCASSGTGCAQARMTPSASTVPPATKPAAAITLAGTDCFAYCTSGRRATCSFLLFTLRLCDLHLVAWMGLGPDCLVAVALAAHPFPTLLPH